MPDSDPAVQESLLECVLCGGFIVFTACSFCSDVHQGAKKAQRNKLCFFQMP
jgi:hypothetical protein